MQKPLDGGLIYRETHPENFLVEPWNAFSSLAFLIPALLFVIQLWPQRKTYGFLIYYCAPLLILGGIGSTLYHAFRSSVWLTFMDFMPIIILTLGVSIYMWRIVLGKWLTTVILTLIFIGLTLFSMRFLDGQDRVNSSYFLRGTFMFLPMLLHAIRSKGAGIGYFSGALLLFVLALLCRYVDEKTTLDIMPQGTHFLWHIFCAAGAWFMGLYLKLAMDADKKRAPETDALPVNA
ncbi:MAG: hypothetical protein ACT6QS_17640 [Flavobacteriales bacterium]